VTITNKKNKRNKTKNKHANMAEEQHPQGDEKEWVAMQKKVISFILNFSCVGLIIA
jgi:hypothetical protein